jgi:hypothetical protein
MSDKEKKFSCNFGTRLTVGDIKTSQKGQSLKKEDKK